MIKRFAAFLVAFSLLTIPVAAGWLINSYRFAVAVSGISLVGTASNQTTNGADVTVTFPGGVATGDVVYAAYCEGATTDINLSTVTSGYTELADVYGNDDTDANLGVYRKVMGASPDASVTFNGSANTNNSVAGVVMILRGVNASPTEDATTTTASGGNTAAADPPSITTVTNNAWVLATGSGAAASASGPSGYTDIVTAAEADTNECVVAISRILKATAGAENPGAFTMSTSMTKSWAAATVAVRPAP